MRIKDNERNVQRRSKNLSKNKLYLKNNNKRRANSLKIISEFGIKRRIAAAIVVVVAIALVIIFQLLLQHATGPDRHTHTHTHSLITRRRLRALCAAAVALSEKL